MTILMTKDYVCNTTTREFRDLKNPDVDYVVNNVGIHLLRKGSCYREVFIKGGIVKK